MGLPARQILQVVIDAGFDDVGALPLALAGDERVQEWVRRGRHGAMTWMERHAPLKADPARAFPEARTVVVAALEYGDPVEPQGAPRRGDISRYALGDDYHEVLKKRLFTAADELKARFPGLETRAFVDTGPLNEKLIAARAGLGFIGRHTNLIHPARGSYFFLGLLLLNRDLDDAPERIEPDRCGTCTACLPACPTGAIIAPYVLDARLCISYLTIELRGPIPRPLRPAVGNRIFGCDDCQEVCPWNRFARRTPLDPFRPREGLRDRSLAEWLLLDLEEWRRIFRRSAVKRARHHGFLRNVLVAAGCSGDPLLAERVRPFLRHEDPLLREHAVWAFHALLGREARDVLEELRISEGHPGVLEEIAAALAEEKPRESSGEKR